MRHLLLQAVNPTLNLEQSLSDWDAISFGLREAPRKRPMKIEVIERNRSSVS